MSSPVYESNKHKTCIMSLFRKNDREIQLYCKTVVMKRKTLPIAQYIDNGMWFIASLSSSTYRVSCENRTSMRVDTKVPFYVITLPSGCYGVSDELTLPMYYQRVSSTSLRDPVITSFANLEFSELPL